MSEFNSDVIVEAARQVATGEVAQEYAGSADDALRAALIEANGGSEVLDPSTFRPGTELFRLVEKVINVTVNEGLKGDEFFMKYVDYVNVAEGDMNIFDLRKNSLLIVSEIGRGNQAIRRQRINQTEQTSIPTSTKAIRVYEHLSRLLAGRIKFNELVRLVMDSVNNKKYEDIYEVFTGISKATPGMYDEVCYTGSYSEDAILDVITHVEADNGGANATIIGTQKVLRQLKMDVVADQAKTDMYAMGYYGRFNGIPTYRIRSRYKAGTHDFIFPDNKLYVVAGKEKFIKFVTEGRGLMDTRQATENFDLTQEYWYMTRWGVGLLMGHAIGLVELSE